MVAGQYSLPQAVDSQSPREVAHNAMDHFWDTHGPAVVRAAQRRGVPLEEYIEGRLTRVVPPGRLIGLDDLPAVIEATDVRIEPACRLALFRGQAPKLTEIEFQLLCLLAANQGLVVSRQFAVEQIWDGYVGSAAVVNVHMARVRAKLGLKAGQAPLETIPQTGYKWA